MNKSVLFVTSLIMLLVISSSCGKPSKRTTEKARAVAEKKAEAEQIATFARRHSAVLDWQTNLPNRGSFGSPFTFDVSKALMPTNDSSILLVMELNDVVEHDGSFRAEFSRSYYKNQFLDLFLNLNCSPQQAAELLTSNEGDSPSRFALVVRVRKVTRPIFTVQSPEEKESEEVDVRNGDRLFRASADCVDLLRLKSGGVLWDE